MKSKPLLILLVLVSVNCSTRDKYDVSRYHNVQEQDILLTQIITFISDAPPLTRMSDRFEPRHHNYYSFLTGKFSIEKYFVAEDGTHYFYVIRPSANQIEKRGVGGHFKMNDDFQFSEFREVFVTPILPESEIKGRCAFLFDEMVKGSLKQYLAMPTYVQWPNSNSYYDTVTYEWKLKPVFDQIQ